MSFSKRLLISILSVSLVLVLFAIPLPSIFQLSFATNMTSSNLSARTISAGSYYSTNWAGYAVTGSKGSVTDANGSWVVPSVSCPKRGSSYAAFWVGIDGFSSSTVEQTGVLAQCSRGRAAYSAWYEFYPAGMVTISSFTVKPGDKVFGEVQSTGGSSFKVTITDGSEKFSTTGSVSGAQMSSAEWIAEAPSSCSIFGCSVLPLANFGTASFGKDSTGISSTSYATVNGVSGSIGSFGSAVQELTMVTNSGTIKAQPSALSTDGTSFSVTWHHS